jgi:spore coat polysaccharide biosynthesis predicted glycosyltransferase SpsG
MSTVREMVESLGSQPYVAIKLGVSSRTIRNWIASNQIGRASRLDFLKMLKQAGYKDVTLKQLNELEPTKQVAKC